MSAPALDQIKFGTDGWRARIAGEFTFLNVARVAQGVADYAAEHWELDRPVVIGYDHRFGSDDFALCVARVLAGNGISCRLTADPAPTPAIAYAAGIMPAAGAVVVTASHNPPADNGIKLRDPTGAALPPSQLQLVEAAIAERAGEYLAISESDAGRDPRIARFDPAPQYLDSLANAFDLGDLAQVGPFVVDSMFGSGAGYLARAFARAGVDPRLIEVRGERNPRFPGLSRPEPIPPHCRVGQGAVIGNSAAVGILNDGDGDRLGIVDEHGAFVDQLRVMSLLAWGVLTDPLTAGPLVRTLTTSAMLDALGSGYGQPVYETGVGMKFVAPKMLEVGAALGGEESGGYVFARHMPERDGMFSGLAFLQLMRRRAARPSELVEQLFDELGRSYHYARIDLQFDAAARPRILDRVEGWQPGRLIGQKVVARLSEDGYKHVLADGSWVLIRFSGTEPLLRVYGEAPSQDGLAALLAQGRQAAGV